MNRNIDMLFMQRKEKITAVISLKTEVISYNPNVTDVFSDSPWALKTDTCSYVILMCQHCISITCCIFARPCGLEITHIRII
jgi:hypothetical protein